LRRFVTHTSKRNWNDNDVRQRRRLRLSELSGLSERNAMKRGNARARRKTLHGKPMNDDVKRRRGRLIDVAKANARRKETGSAPSSADVRRPRGPQISVVSENAKRKKHVGGAQLKTGLRNPLGGHSIRTSSSEFQEGHRRRRFKPHTRRP
jgi:hypothetical protein